MGPEESKKFCEANTEIAMIMITPGRTRQDIEIHTCNLPEDKWVRLMD